MNGFDRSILLGLNQFAHHVRWADELMVEMNRSALFKGGVVLSGLWWLWFAPRGELRRVRSILLAALMGGFLALFVGRLLALMLPFRPRPIHDPALHFVMPYGTGPGELRGWSSFPSDHAMMYVALALGLGFVSKRVGTFLLIWTLLVICLPRIYAGQHYPTDVLGGALIGAILAVVVQRQRLRAWLTGLPLDWSERHPASFYAALFLLTFQIATMFADLRQVLQIIYHAVRGIGG